MVPDQRQKPILRPSPPGYRPATSGLHRCSRLLSSLLISPCMKETLLVCGSLTEHIEAATPIVLTTTHEIGDAVAVCEVLLENVARVETPLVGKTHRHTFDRLK